MSPTIFPSGILLSICHGTGSEVGLYSVCELC